ncbi:hypothetical protein JR316_0002141 [Psilocybe cubensis]|nr:hypothetical protein JR316_0002141 [Psilocybe cubensis]KAH9485234.1 hypothetical protein JR316_0002141 [Psilocybe cubensis]
MKCLLNTFDRYETIWSCMDMMPAIVKALDNAHQVWKLRGVQSRPLLALLTKFDRERYLEEGSRERISSDVAAFTLALQPIGEQIDIVPNVLPEILLLAGDPDPNAPSILSNSLWIKYRTSTDWAWKVWDNTVASLRQIPSMMSELEDRRACALRYGTFLWRVDQHLPEGLDRDVSEWLTGPGRAEVMALSVDTWDVLKTVLLFLTVHGALKTTTILEGLIYPAWQLGAAKSLGQSFVSETYLSAANSLCFNLLLQEEATNGTVPPTDLFELQGIRTRRQTVYDEPHFSLLVASIPTLISLENNPDIPETLRQETTTLRCRLCQESGFRRGAYRNLEIIRDAFENSPFLLDEDPDSEHLRKSAIAGLNMILCDSTDETNIYDWPELGNLLTPWKIAATTIQMQLQVKQLGRALNHESTSEFAISNLNKIASMLFHHTKTAEEAYYVGEMARGADSTVAAKFINNGFQCIVELLVHSQSDRTLPGQDSLRRAGDLLGILIHVSQPFRDGPTLPSVDPPIHEAFIAALEISFKSLEKELFNGHVKSQAKENLLLLIRLLQFVLSYKNTWTPKNKVARLMSWQHYSVGDDFDDNIYPILIDTLLVLLDELQCDSKSIAFDPFKHYPNTSIDNLPTDMPPEHRIQFTTLLAHNQPHSLVMHLVHAQRDAQGNVVYGIPVVNKPWEWIENLGEPIITDPKEEEREREEKRRLKVKYLIKNSGSVSLEHFGARFTGEGMTHVAPSDERASQENCARSFEDGMTQNIFIRDWRETRLESEHSRDPVARLKADFDSEPVFSIDPQTLQASRTSPTPSVISRSSTQATSSSLHQSPTSRSRNSNSATVHEIIDVDNFSNTGTSTFKANDTHKRKASVAAISDDEVEIIEGPGLSRSANAKKQKAGKGPVAGKTKPRKK